MSAIYILDRVQLRPGQLQAYQRALRERYLPGARKRGMELIGSWITPPVEVEEGNELVTIWSLPSIEASPPAEGPKEAADETSPPAEKPDTEASEPEEE